MKIAVTGASGYLGSSFLKMYGDTYEIAALSRSAAKASDITDRAITYVQTDYSPESLKDVLSGCEAVVHLAYAMATKDNEAGGLASYESSMETTRNVLSAAHGLGISNIVFASSRLVYPAFSDRPFREDDTLQPQNHYAESKVMMEELCEDYNRNGSRIKVLRFGQIIGADMKVKGMFHVFMDKASKNEPLTLIGSDVRDYIHVKDACGAIDAALRHPEASGIFNISMGIGTDNRMMANAVIEALGSSSEIRIKETGNKKNPDRIVLDCTKAKDELGFSCRNDTILSIAKDVAKD